MTETADSVHLSDEVLMRLPKDQERFVRDWKRLHRSPQERLTEQLYRAENWKLLAIILGWALLFALLFR